MLNVTDDKPTAQGVPVAFAAELLGLEPPPQIPFAEAAKGMTEMALSFYGESKRVRNDRLKRELNVTLRYPTFREGLRGLLRERRKALADRLRSSRSGRTTITARARRS